MTVVRSDARKPLVRGRSPYNSDNRDDRVSLYASLEAALDLHGSSLGRTPRLTMRKMEGSIMDLDEGPTCIPAMK